jgi:hypothetical protein
MSTPTLTAFATLNGVPLSPGPLLSVLGGEIVMTEVGGFNKSSIFWGRLPTAT